MGLLLREGGEGEREWEKGKEEGKREEVEEGRDRHRHMAAVTSTVIQ